MREYAIEMSDIKKSFKDFTIENFNLKVEKGFITGFIGPNGSGKTTTIKLIMNLIKPENGNIKIFGKDVKNNEEEIRERIGFVYAENTYYDHLTVKQTGDLIAPFYRKWDTNIFLSYVTLFQLPKNKKVKTLSTGMKIKLSLAIALSHSADLIILDEPTSGLDPIVRSEVLNILYEIIQDENKTVLFSSHITSDLDKIADTIAFINNGKLIFNQAKDDILLKYKIVKGPSSILDNELRSLFISFHETPVGFEGLSFNYKTFEELFGDQVLIEPASLEEIVVYIVKGAEYASITS
ncbi:ABC transporter ATP-binding protein [Marinilactibacillus psychrotolerans]|uniref:phenol-soluble modulin export ABC transporter ATP-binding protein PmtA n=1 Tax=Marinilactibacillus psychrotolerans TaxID=191770 RepID=UPI003883F833